jgi:nucleoside-diphosphate-sugar epimerase
MNILVTGATGFIGRHLTAALSKTHFVRCLVRTSSDTSVLRNFDTEIIYGDLLDKNSLGLALDGIDLVYHLAGEVYSRRKEDYYKGNVLATENLLEACKEKGVKRIVFLSSIGVYKPAHEKTFLTEDSDCEPITYYGKTKLDAEGLVKRTDIPWVIVRAPVIYGPYQPAVVNRFFLDALNKRKIYTIGRENNARSLCFIDNLIDGLTLLMNNPGTNGKIYIFSDNFPYTLDQIVTTMFEVTGRKIEIVRLPDVLGTIAWQVYKMAAKLFNLYFIELYALKTMQLHWECDISKAKNEVGYNPTVTLRMGIQSTMEWIKNWIKN